VKNATAETIRNGGSAGAGCGLACGVGTPARAQVLNSAASPIALRAVLSQSLTVTLSGNAVNFNLVSGSANNPGSTSITATTSWILQTPVAIVSLYAFLRTQAPR